MDPVSQGALGAALPQTVGDKLKFRDKALTITWVGCLAGMSPDMDVFIRSSVDPLLFLEFHRQFTHALLFIPFGALICATLFHYWARSKLSFRLNYLVCLLGYSTHAVLDACTTYGTQLFWPISDERVAWNTIAVVDPLATVPLLICVVLAARRANPHYARVGLAWFLIYLSIGWIQRDRANEAAEYLAATRGHQGAEVSAKPGFANLLLWKSVYEHEGQFYVDALRVGSNIKIYPGDRIAKLDLARDIAWIDKDSQQARDIERFRWFSMDYLALDPTNENFVIDVRYSVIPNEIKPLWGILLNPQQDAFQHVEFVADRDTSSKTLTQLWSLLTGDACNPDASQRHSHYVLCEPTI